MVGGSKEVYLVISHISVNNTITCKIADTSIYAVNNETLSKFHSDSLACVKRKTHGYTNQYWHLGGRVSHSQTTNFEM